ncbi:MAG: hypothetical protein ABW087_20075, partial [Candidatus Thiodiazotropha sp.]
VFSMFYGETIVTKTIDYQASFLILNGTAVMRNHEYPQVSSHHREHALLQAELSDLIREIEEGKRRLDIETLTSLKYWLIDHVIDSDMDIARYMNSR